MVLTEERLVKLLHGIHIHVDPLKALEGLPEDQATAEPWPEARSPYQLLTHMVYWQDYSLALIEGTPHQHEEGRDWEPTGETWRELTNRFKAGLESLERHASGKPDRRLEVAEGLSTTVAAEIMGVAQHNSYHLGQLVQARKALGSWPPEPEYA